jgi:hypothetical protein
MMTLPQGLRKWLNFSHQPDYRPSCKQKVLDDLSTIICKINTLKYISRDAQATLFPLAAKAQCRPGGCCYHLAKKCPVTDN